MDETGKTRLGERTKLQNRSITRYNGERRRFGRCSKKRRIGKESRETLRDRYQSVKMKVLIRKVEDWNWFVTVKGPLKCRGLSKRSTLRRIRIRGTQSTNPST